MQVKLIIEVRGERQIEPIKDFLFTISRYHGAMRRNHSRGALQYVLVQLKQLMDAGMVKLLDCEICDEDRSELNQTLTNQR